MIEKEFAVNDFSLNRGKYLRKKKTRMKTNKNF